MKRSHLVIFSACLGIIFASFIITVYLWHGLPELIPTHFNIAGTPDSWSAKNSIWLFFVPVINLAIYLLFLLLYRHPQYTSWPTTLILMAVEETKREKVFHVLRTMLAYLMITITVMFGYLQFSIIATANGRAMGLATGAMIAFLIFIFAVIIGVNIRMFATIHRILKEEKKTS